MAVKMNVMRENRTPVKTIGGGATGVGIAEIILTEDDMLEIHYTNGVVKQVGPVRGNGILSIVKTSTAGLVDTYTITYTDGATTTFTVTNGDGDMNKYVYDTNNDGVVNEADRVKWSGVYEKPATYPPSEHNHDSRYYTEAETDAAIGEETQRATQRENEIEGEIPDVIDAVNSTSTEDALSANMGKELQQQITNLKNLGRFCAIWRADTGLPTSQPTESPYVYKVGDYFRIGAAGYRVPTGSTYVQGAYDTVAEETGIGDVWYYDGSVWRKQASSGGGTVQDVLVNGTSVLDGGIAEITVPTLLADLIEDATHRLVTDTEKTLWDSKTKVTINRWESDD